MTNTSNKKLSRRDAIKLLGAAAGAAALANLPAKWSTPELTGGVLPAHAQTSGCATGTSSMSVFVQGAGSISTDDIGDFTESGDFLTGYTAFFDCISDCFFFRVTSNDASDVHVIFTVNGVVVFDQTYNNTTHFVLVNGATGEYGIDNLVGGCAVG